MPREAELTGIVRPEIDEQAASRETSRLSGMMDEAAQIAPSIDTSKLRRSVEQALPGGGLLGSAVDSLTGRGGPAGSAGGGAAGVAGESVQVAQLEKLEDIHDELEKLGSSGGGGGGGGIAVLGGGGLLGGAGAAAGAFGLSAGLAGTARFALGQGVFGEAGKKSLQSRTRFEGLSGVENAASDPAGFLATGFKNAYDPTGIGETMARSFVSSIKPEDMPQIDLMDPVQTSEKLTQYLNDSLQVDAPDELLSGIDVNVPQQFPDNGVLGIDVPTPLQQFLGGGGGGSSGGTASQQAQIDRVTPPGTNRYDDIDGGSGGGSGAQGQPLPNITNDITVTLRDLNLDQLAENVQREVERKIQQQLPPGVSIR